MTARLRSDEGVALPIALAFVSMFALLIAAVLSFAETGLRSSNALEGQGMQIAAADGALHGAINRARGDVDVGVEGYDETCFSPPQINQTSVIVRCVGQDGSGEISGGGGADDEPTHALLTLGTGAGGEEGIEKEVAATTLNVGGSVFSNASIKVAGGLTATGEVQALGDCSGIIASGVPPVACANRGPAPDANDGLDPGYAAEIGSRPANRSVPACPSGWLVTFQPGTYTNGSGLNDLFDTCTNRVFHFTPGTYYFEFIDGTESARRWLIMKANATLVGGVPSGWNPSAPSKPAVPVPGSCDTGSAGVQFVFGADSRLEVTAGSVELCPPRVDGEQRIAIYGMPPADAGTPVVKTVTASAASGAFTPTANARLIDGSTGSASFTASNPGASRTASLTGFTGVPAGVTLTDARIRVAHQEAPTNQIASVKATVTPASGSPVTVTIPTRSNLTTDSVDLLAAGLSPSVDATSFTVDHVVTAKNNKAPSAFLDGIELVLTYLPPALAGQSGCVTQTPFAPSGGCAFIKASGPSSAFIVHGTIYAPAGAMSVAVEAGARAIFGRGIIARTAVFKITGGWTQIDPIVGLPGGGSPPVQADRSVLFTAVIDEVDRIRALVTFEDGNGATPGAVVTVEEWSVLR